MKEKPRECHLCLMESMTYWEIFLCKSDLNKYEMPAWLGWKSKEKVGLCAFKNLCFAAIWGRLSLQDKGSGWCSKGPSWYYPCDIHIAAVKFLLQHWKPQIMWEESRIWLSSIPALPVPKPSFLKTFEVSNLNGAGQECAMLLWTSAHSQALNLLTPSGCISVACDKCIIASIWKFHLPPKIMCKKVDFSEKSAKKKSTLKCIWSVCLTIVLPCVCVTLTAALRE